MQHLLLTTALLLILLALPAAAGEKACDQRHLADAQSGAVYQDSPFLHGYVHGYEEGFHFGDTDVHLARREPQPESARKRKQVEIGYRRDFGDRKDYRAGFDGGFMRGYMDAFEGRRFLGYQALREAAAREQHPQRATTAARSGRD